jgi:hypothetical protein
MQLGLNERGYLGIGLTLTATSSTELTRPVFRRSLKVLSGDGKE